MKIKGVQEDNLKRFIEPHYDLRIDRITYFPHGEDGACYIAEMGSKKYFLKVYNKGELAFKSIIELKIIINFLYDLKRNYGFNNSPLPIKNRNGSLISKFQGLPVVIYDYIPGRNMKEINQEDYKKLGKILGEIHSLDKKRFSGIKNEKIDLKWEKKIFKVISELRSSQKDKFLTDQILPREKLFKEGINFLLNEVEKVKTKRSEYVIVHSDLHRGNIMKDKDALYVIDWDGLEFALPEKDILWFSDGLKINKDFLKEYKKEMGKKFHIDKAILKFYIVKRIFHEIVFFSRALLFRDSDRSERKMKTNLIVKNINKLEKILR